MTDRLKRRVRAALAGERLQPTWEAVHRAALAGMNFGPSLPSNSGELAVVDALRRANLGRPTIFDVGANVGDYAASVIEHLGTDIRLECFEPSAVGHAALVRRFAGDACVTVHNLGAGHTTEELPFYGDEAGSPGASLFARRGVGPVRELERVVVRPLADVADELGVERVHLLKLDVEGNELAALRGAQRLIDDARIDAIQFEVGGSMIDSRVFLRDFFEALEPQYLICRVVQGGLYAVPRYEERLEIFVTANYVALLRESPLFDAFRRRRAR